MGPWKVQHHQFVWVVVVSYRNIIILVTVIIGKVMLLGKAPGKARAWGHKMGDGGHGFAKSNHNHAMNTIGKESFSFPFFFLCF